MKTRNQAGGEGWALVKACPRCGKDQRSCRCPPAPPRPAGRPTVRLRMEKRRGKPVTVLATEGISPSELEALSRELKAACGAGGTLKDAELELQGEHRERVKTLLAGRGYVVKG
ncbi:MAG: translation initiation factor [Deltaproteobacteria bacterium]|nr:translation initiation factor [Deltaproteobacteria bacterium]